MSHTYLTQEQINVPAIRETEPALSELYLARQEHIQREQKLFIWANRRRSRRPDRKSAPDYVEAYLESAAKEIVIGG